MTAVLTEIRTTGANTAYCKNGGRSCSRKFLHLTKLCAGRQLSAFYSPSSQSPKR